ncbi:MAG: hypothetical protein AAF490_17505 [Chloroflexota bacterium]
MRVWLFVYYLCMTTPIILTNEEKEQLTRWLSRRALISGGTFIGIGLVPLIIMLVVSLLNSHQFSVTVETFGAIFGLPICMGLIGFWLIGRRQAVRRWFDELMELGNGRILTMNPRTDSGSFLTFEIINELGERFEASMGYIGTPDWKVGDEIELIVWKNGRFCPRHFDHLVDVAYLPTPARVRRSKLIGNTILISIGLLVGIGILFAIFGDG